MVKDLIVQQMQHVGVITLNRPSALNALTLEMILALEHQLHEWHTDESIHAVVIQAAPGKAFCAGGDVRWIYENREAPSQKMQFFWHEYRLNHTIHAYKKPYIALMDGITMGGGVGISLHGSHRVASPQFLFAMPETGIGFFPDIGSSYLLSRCPGYWGMYLALTGQRLASSEARALGLVDHIIRAEQFSEILNALCELDLSTNAHSKISEYLAAMSISMDSDSVHSAQPLIDSTFNRVDIESIVDGLSQATEAWSEETLLSLKQKAPLSLKVTLVQMNKAKRMSMAECIHMDYCLVGHFMRDQDFYEGVRALLVDKDKSPHWQPGSLSAVSATQVAKYFECGQPGLPLELMG